MTLKGMDISNNNAGLSPEKLDVDFCICKASQGIAFTDTYMNGWLKKLKAKKIKCGVYHFASMYDAKKEAAFFYSKVKTHLSYVIPFLDYEVWNLERDHVKWCETFINEFYRLSGKYCGLYISASNCSRFKGSFIPNKCVLWVAGYPKKYTAYTTDKMPYDISPWKSAAIWQFTDVLKLASTSQKLDGDIAYTDLWATKKPATKPNASTPTAKPKVFQGAGRYKVVTDVLNVRNGAGLNKTKVAKYKRGEYVNLDNWSTEKDGYIWGKYKSYTGKTRYIAIGTSNGKLIYLKKV